MRPKGEAERERELAVHYQSHKEEGEWEPVEYERSTTRAGAVYSIRFTAEELGGLRAIANREGKRISQIIREAVSQYIAGRHEQRSYTEVDFKRAIYFSYTAVTSNPTSTTAPQLKWSQLPH